MRSLIDSFIGMGYRIEDDVGHVVVGKRVGDLPSAPLAVHKTRTSQNSQVLRDQGLLDAEGVDQLVDAAIAVAQLQHDRQPKRAAEGLEQLGCLLELGWRTDHNNILQYIHW
jgi:hypothetical protein